MFHDKLRVSNHHTRDGAATHGGGETSRYLTKKKKNFPENSELNGGSLLKFFDT